MAICNRTLKISVVIPCLNEAENLPLLLADLNRWPGAIEICISDGGSSDLTTQIAKIHGCKVLKSQEANRGKQMHLGACKTSSEWILFIHADSRLPNKWTQRLDMITKDPYANKNAWFFDFRLQPKARILNVLEIAVAIRSNLFQNPYGDQGLFISRSLYKEIGGYRNLHLMEDIDFIKRLLKKTKLKRIGLPLYTNQRGWINTNILSKALSNLQLRRRWSSGESTKNLSKDYYQN